MTPTILVADDDKSIRTVLQKALMRAGYEVQVTSSLARLWQWVSQGEGDLVISDIGMPDGDGLELLPKFRKIRPALPVILISARNSFLTAVRASEEQAYDYLAKPFDLNELLDVVGRALASKDGRADEDMEVGQEGQLPLIGRSQAMQEVYRVMARVMQSNLTVLIHGDSGTGKELIARALHDFGLRKQAPFVPVNMAAVPENLIESELFGYEAGAFTGAQKTTPGRFEQARGGTLFLDEIGDMPLEAQTRLLRVLQEGEFSRVGGRSFIKTDVRIIAASNKNIGRMAGRGQFREDLYYRLNVLPLHVPALRNRLEDIELLVRHFAGNLVEEGLAAKIFTPEAIVALQQHDWPGNVRELENLVRRVMVIFPQEVISEREIKAQLAATACVQSPVWQNFEKQDWLADYIGWYLEQNQAMVPGGEIYAHMLARFELPLITEILRQCDGNQIKTAEKLGINRNTLRKKIRELDIKAYLSKGEVGK